jgi:hypothetical protein
MKILLILLLLCPGRAYADEKKAADIISYGTVAAQITFNTIYNWHEPDKKRALVMEAAKNFIVIAASETIKHIVHEERPDKSDNLSFWSEHSALAAVNMGYRYRVGFSLTLATATGRVIAKKHHWWDTAVGAGVGMLVDQFVR